MAKTKVLFAGKVIDGEALESEEKQLLLSTVYDYLAADNSFLKELFKVNEGAILAAASVAKDRLDAPIRGMLAGDAEVGVQLIRPGHILRDTTTAETPINTWDSDSITSGAFAAGNDYWIGSGSANSTPVKISQYLTLVIFGVMWTQGNAPTVEEIYLQIGSTTYAPFVVRPAWAGDNPNRIRAARFHPLLAEPRATILAQVRSSVAGRQELVLLGLAFGKGSYLRNQSYAAADLP